MNYFITPTVDSFNNSENSMYNFGLALQRPLSTFHSRFVKWNELPPNSPLKKIVIRIVTIIAAPILYLILGVLSVTGQILVAIYITTLRKVASPGWQQKAMALIRKSRYDDPCVELERLKTTKVLTDDLSARLDASINKVNPMLSKKKLDQIKMIMAQALEVKSVYSDTHHVFIHAQASNWLGLTYLVKELHREFEPNTHIKHFKFLRPPLKLAKPGIVSSLWKSFRNTFLEEEKITNVQEYIDSKWFVMDSDGETREHLLSVDGYFFNTQKSESSLYFLVNNSNILGNPSTIKSFYKEIIKHYRPNLSDQTLSNLADQVFNAVKLEEAACGNLFIICVPKEKSKEVQYRAHPFGSVCTCHSATKNDAILEQLQKGLFDSSVECEGNTKIPQYRVYTPMLKPGVTPIYLLTPHGKMHRKAMKAKIRETVKELHHC